MEHLTVFSFLQIHLKRQCLLWSTNFFHAFLGYELDKAKISHLKVERNDITKHKLQSTFTLIDENVTICAPT